MKKHFKRIMSSILSLAVMVTFILPNFITARANNNGIEKEKPVTVTKNEQSREINFNEDWQFHLATSDPEVDGSFTNGLKDAGEHTTEDIIKTDFDDSSWRTVTVPHDFAIEGEKTLGQPDSQSYLKGGLGFYRKTFTLDESLSGKNITIDFDGVHQNSVVYLNGKEIGKYPNGYTGFAYDITSELYFGDNKANTIVVKVQDMAASGRWYTGSGIIRPVSLVVKDSVRINRNGVKLSTPNLEQTFKNYEMAELEVELNGYSTANNGSVYMETTVLDSDEHVIMTKESSASSSNPSTVINLSDTVEIDANDIKLWYSWNIGEPTLYTVRTSLYYKDDGSSTGEFILMDSIENKFGFRWFDVIPADSKNAEEGGIYINDVYTKMQGVDLHHDSGALGAISNKDAYERQFEKLKSMGSNAYRTSHCPPSKEVIEVCSEMGFIVMEEAYDGWYPAKASYDFGNFFFMQVPNNWAGLVPNGLTQAPKPAVDYDGVQYTWSEWVIREMVNRDYNEPSVMMWSIGNEVRGVQNNKNVPSWYKANAYADFGLGLTTNNTIDEYTEAVRLGETVREIDSTRLVNMGGDQERRKENQVTWDNVWGRVNRYLDGYGLNYNTADSVDYLFEIFSPDKTKTFFFESESSSQTSSRGVYFDPNLLNTGVNQTPGRRGGSGYDNDFASWTMSNEYGLKKDRDRKGFAGQFIWTGFDYLGEPTPYSVYPVGVSSFGCIDTAGFPKDSYYLYRSQWTSQVNDPMVHLLPDDWDRWREGENVEVWVNTNVKTVELWLNGKKLDTKNFDTKKTAYGKEYYETSEKIADDKSWPTSKNNGNTGGYASVGATVLDASGSSEIVDGTNYGRLHLTFDVPFERGVLEARAFNEKGEQVATDVISSSNSPYTLHMDSWKEVIAADGNSLTYIEGTVVDENGNEVSNANNLFKFDVTGGSIVGVDNGKQESTELYKWGNIERNTHSERSAYAGKVLVILQSNKNEVGTMTLTASTDGLVSSQININVTEDGTGTKAKEPASLNSTAISTEDINITVPVGIIPTLPVVANVNYSDSQVPNYSISTSVNWDSISDNDVSKIGNFTVKGLAGGIEVNANIQVIEKEPTDIALNTALGNNSDIYSFDKLSEDSQIRNGALATASFSGSNSNYPNQMLNGNTSTSNRWTNAYSRSATVLLPTVTESKPAEYIEFYWDEIKAFDQIHLNFYLSSSTNIPETLTAEYWNGREWVGVNNETIVKANVSNSPTVISFTPVTTERVRVHMTNATPYTTKGNMAIITANIMSPGSVTPEPPRENIALSKHAIASSENLGGKNGDEVAGNAVDGDESIKWCAKDGTYPQWVQVDLENIYQIDKIKLALENDNEAFKFYVSVSDSPDDWSEEHIVIDKRDNSTDIEREWDINSTSRYIRISFEKGTNQYWAVVSELYAFGELAEIPEPIDTAVLSGKLSSAKALDEDDYTVETWNVLQGVITEAESLLSNTNATQEQVDAMAASLQTAIDSLKEKPVTPVDPGDLDIDLLDYMIKEAEYQVENGGLSGVMPIVIENFNKALENAKATYKKAITAPEVVTQAEIDLATENLIGMLHLLDFKGTKGKLQRLVTQSEKFVADKDLYRPATYKVFEKALKEAKAMLDDEYSFQDEIDAAWLDLAAGLAGLRKIPNKQALINALNEAEKIDPALYTTQSYSFLSMYMNEGYGVLDMDDDEIEQEYLDKTAGNLVAAKSGLVLLSENPPAETEKPSEKEDEKNGSTATNTNPTQLSIGGKAPKTGEIGSAIVFILLVLSSSLTLIIKKKQNSK